MANHPLELKWIHHHQDALRGPFTDAFFTYWNYFNTTEFILIFIATIMYLFNRKEGVSLLFIFIIDGVLNIFLKAYFDSPRPSQIDPSVSIICDKALGFPSGGAIIATIILGAAFHKCRQNITKMLAILFALVFYFSGIYLGLHFFTDILGGIGVGVVLVVIYLKLFPILEKHWVKFAFGLSVLFVVLGGVKLLPQAATIVGVGIGLLLSKQNKLPTSKRMRILTLLVVILGSSGLFYLGEIFSHIKPLAALFAGFWFVYLGNFLVSACCKKTRVL